MFISLITHWITLILFEILVSIFVSSHKTIDFAYWLPVIANGILEGSKILLISSLLVVSAV